MTDNENPPGNPIIDAGQYNLGTATGWDLSVGRDRLLGEWGLEAGYFAIDGWEATTPEVFAPNKGSGLGGGWVRFVGSNGSSYDSYISSTYRSQLYGVEINGRKELSDRFTFLAGFRYVDLSEGLDIVQYIPHYPVTADFAIDAHNHLAGFQIGLDGQLYSGRRLSIEAIGKAGIYANNASNSVWDPLNPALPWGCSASEVHAAFVGELGVAGGYAITEHLSVRGGYKLLWLDGAALASRQIPVSDPDGRIGGIDTSGSVFYHGAFAGLEYRR